MNWLIIILCTIPLCFISLIIINMANRKLWVITGVCLCSICFAVVLGIGIPLGLCKENIYDKHDWYIETRLKYAEAEGIEKEYLEMTDVMTYNLWYERNKEDIENPWNFKSVAECEFDYIKIKGETK